MQSAECRVQSAECRVVGEGLAPPVNAECRVQNCRGGACSSRECRVQSAECRVVGADSISARFIL